MGPREAESFLTHLAVDARVAAATHNQALQALLFLYRHVLEIELPLLCNVTRIVRSTLLYTHVLGKGAMGAKSPLDR